MFAWLWGMTDEISASITGSDHVNSRSQQMPPGQFSAHYFMAYVLFSTSLKPTPDNIKINISMNLIMV